MSIVDVRKKRVKNGYDNILKRVSLTEHKFKVYYRESGKDFNYVDFKEWVFNHLDETSNEDFCHWLFMFFTQKFEADFEFLKGLFHEYNLNSLSVLEEYEEGMKKMGEEINELKEKLEPLELLKLQHEHMIKNIRRRMSQRESILKDEIDDLEMLEKAFKGAGGEVVEEKKFVKSSKTPRPL